MLNATFLTVKEYPLYCNSSIAYAALYVQEHSIYSLKSPHVHGDPVLLPCKAKRGPITISILCLRIRPKVRKLIHENNIRRPTDRHEYRKLRLLDLLMWTLHSMHHAARHGTDQRWSLHFWEAKKVHSRSLKSFFFGRALPTIERCGTAAVPVLTVELQKVKNFLAKSIASSIQMLWEWRELTRNQRSCPTVS